MIMVSEGVETAKGAPELGEYGLLRAVSPRGRDTFEVQATRSRCRVVDPALAWSDKLSVEVGGVGTVAQAGVVLPRLLADRLGLCTELAGVMARAGVLSVAASGAGVGGRGVLAGRGSDVSG